MLEEVGYILRTTAVYGNGKFGIADFELLKKNQDFKLTFSAQMAAVYLIRNFSIDWVHFLAKRKGKEKAVELDKRIQEYLGVGNATGLGMSLYLIRHPKIIDKWLYEREKALAKTLAQPISEHTKLKMEIFLLRGKNHLKQVYTINDDQKKNNLLIVEQINSIIAILKTNNHEMLLWNDFFKIVKKYPYESQEIVISCLLELYPYLVDEHEKNMNVDEKF